MNELTPRQVDVLKAIVEEYSASGESVGSMVLEKKYKLGVSPATIRNEMVVLEKKGFLKKNYFSSGRNPSTKGLRFYINNLMKEDRLATVDEIGLRNSIWDDRDELYRLLSRAVRVLAEKTGLLSIVSTDRDELYYSGTANLFDEREFSNLEKTKTILTKLEEVEFWHGVVGDWDTIEKEIIFLLGEEDFGDPSFNFYGSVFGEFRGESVKGVIGVVGPDRMCYHKIVPQVRYFTNLVKNILKEKNW